MAFTQGMRYIPNTCLCVCARAKYLPHFVLQQNIVRPWYVYFNVRYVPALPPS